MAEKVEQETQREQDRVERLHLETLCQFCGARPVVVLNPQPTCANCGDALMEIECPRCGEADERAIGVNRCGLCECEFFVATNGLAYAPAERPLAWTRTINTGAGLPRKAK